VWYLTSHLPSEIKPSDYLELFFASSSSSFFTLARFIQVSCVVSRVVLLWKMVFIDINLYSLHTGRQIITIEKTTLENKTGLIWLLLLFLSLRWTQCAIHCLLDVCRCATDHPAAAQRVSNKPVLLVNTTPVLYNNTAPQP
jgi:hypothetical protein